MESEETIWRHKMDGGGSVILTETYVNPPEEFIEHGIVLNLLQNVQLL